MIIDAHLHLWDTQQGMVNGNPVVSIGGGRSDFGGEIRQMLPPYLLDGKNHIEPLLSNMAFAGVSGCVVTQEYIDGNQDAYLRQVKARYPEQIRICSLFEQNGSYCLDGFDGLKICAGRLSNPNLLALLPVFKKLAQSGKFLSIDLAQGTEQVGMMREIIEECPQLRIAIGHFGMVGRAGWIEQIKLADNPHVYIESGGITWLFHEEFYPYPSAVRAICQAAETVGIEKLMWGSDYPRTMTAITYRMSLDFVQKSKELTREEKAAFLGGNAKNFYHFADLEEPKPIKHMAQD